MHEISRYDSANSFSRTEKEANNIQNIEKNSANWQNK